MSVAKIYYCSTIYDVDKKFDLPEKAKGVPFLDPEEENSAEANEEMTPIVVNEYSREVLPENVEELDGLSVKDDQSMYTLESINESTALNLVANSCK